MGYIIQILSVQMKNRIMSNAKDVRAISESALSSGIFHLSIGDCLTAHLNAVADEAHERMEVLEKQMMEK